MENRIKEQQLDLFADRTSCHKWWPNQFRLLLALPGLHAHGGHPPPRARGHDHSPCPVPNHPPEIAPDRRRHRAQHAARSFPAIQRLSRLGHLSTGGRQDDATVVLQRSCSQRARVPEILPPGHYPCAKTTKYDRRGPKTRKNDRQKRTPSGKPGFATAKNCNSPRVPSINDLHEISGLVPKGSCRSLGRMQSCRATCARVYGAPRLER
jgi:hypothetical protein